jgi:TonB family protein
MQKLGKDRSVHKARIVGYFAGTLLLAAAQTAAAQAPAGNTDNAPSEAARRAAASPYRFILQNATAPRRAAPAPAPAVEPKRAAPPPPVQQATAQPQRAAPAPVEAAPPPAPAPAPAPEAAVASVSRQPAAEPPPVRRDIIPIQTDEPHLSPALLREEPKGTVKIHFDINYDGSVGEVKVISSSNRSLNKPTVEAVKGWKFQPVDEVLTVETEVVYNLEKQ